MFSCSVERNVQSLALKEVRSLLAPAQRRFASVSPYPADNNFLLTRPILINQRLVTQSFQFQGTLPLRPPRLCRVAYGGVKGDLNIPIEQTPFFQPGVGCERR